MSDRYPFLGDKTLITHDGHAVWSQQVAVQSSLDFSNVTDSTLTDSINESYATAVEDNETQYLSILETTNDITLESLHNLTLGNSKIISQENLELSNENIMENPDVNGVNMEDQQVVVFSLEGSEDLYGIQFAQDEEGNIQKYQFKFRTTADGQLEAIPESILLLPYEEDTNEKVNEGSQILIQDVENDETEEQETHVVFQEESDVQETQIYMQEEEDDMTEELVQVENDEKDVRVLIKNEPDQGTVCSQSDNSEDEDEFVENTEMIEEQEHFQTNHVDLQYKETETVPEDEDDYEEETIDIKAGILEESLALRNTILSPPNNVKQEMHLEDSRDSPLNEQSEMEDYHIYNHQEDIKQVHYDDKAIHENATIDIHGHVGDHYEAVEVDGTQETVLEYQHYISEDNQHVYEETETTNSEDLIQDQHDSHYEQLFIQESHIRHRSKGKLTEVPLREEDEEEGLEEQFATEVDAENDSDNDDYQIVEGLHITAEGDIGEESTSVHYQEPETILQEVIEKPPAIERANILKQTSIIRAVKDVKAKNNKTVVYYVVPHLEKENVNSLPVNNNITFRSVKTNPRSILKSSFPETKEEGELESKNVVDERLNKRFARSKEAVQARLFNNFISKTTIPHAPVRQTRLPRKQEIKPVDTRRNEEIIVQEVMVSSNGFIENVAEKLKNKDKLEITGYVVLSDSDDDYDPKHGTKKKKKHKKHKKIDVYDSDESDISIIEIFQSDEEEEARKGKDSPKRGRGRPRKSIDSKETMDSMKRRRGRPPKSSHANNSDSEESPMKKSRTESEESDTTKKEIKCPHCTKTFPSQNSLSTHIQHHNLENSLRNSQANKASTKSAPTIEYKHKCEACQMTFKNSILLKRHACQKQVPTSTKRLNCTLCKKTFPDAAALNVHKRTHIKENLVKSTSIATVSPKKFLPRPSTSKMKPPQRPISSRTAFKCKECSRQCFSQEGFSLHEKTHKKHTCSTCNASFPSRLLLDTHTRVNCVKTASPLHRRMSYKIRKSFVHSPKKRTARLTRGSLAPSGSAAANTTNTLGVNVQCEVCGEKFTTFQDKFKHQVKMHGLKTPDKSILEEEKKLLHKPKNMHGGIPAREGMRKVFAEIRSKMALITPNKDKK